MSVSHIIILAKKITEVVIVERFHDRINTIRRIVPLLSGLRLHYFDLTDIYDNVFLTQFKLIGTWHI